ncbi:unnamed protein product [Neisseria lactamica Y92-1009]|uniref:Uncharacterized protein n=1 Tax=Neisseria lactamica TaxID=486 RepID=A0AAU8VD17_NEILA|nr:hypothetical protein B2G52_03110 [Neisseria lactamica]CBX23183.1 unnamed protein product [Neisseria lactamica Y92-1009]
MEAAQHLAEIKNLIRQGYDEFPQKKHPAVLTVYVFKRIVRVFAADEAAVMKQFKRSLTKQITDKCECLGPHTV